MGITLKGLRNAAIVNTVAQTPYCTGPRNSRRSCPGSCPMPFRNAGSFKIPEPTRTNCAVPRKGIEAAAKFTSDLTGNSGQHKIMTVPHPAIHSLVNDAYAVVCTLLQLIVFVNGACSVSRAQKVPALSTSQHTVLHLSHPPGGTNCIQNANAQTKPSLLDRGGGPKWQTFLFKKADFTAETLANPSRDAMPAKLPSHAYAIIIDHFDFNRILAETRTQPSACWQRCASRMQRY